MMGGIRDLATRLKGLGDVRALRYLFASVVALAADVGTFWLLARSHVDDALASAIGYAIGIGVHWLISSRIVFGESVAKRGFARSRQKGLFALSAFIGLAVTTAIVGFADWMRFDTLIAKLFAVGVSFTLTYLLRARIVFRTEGAAPVAGRLA